MTIMHMDALLAEPVEPLDRKDVINPFSQAVIATVDLMDERAVDKALDVAQAAFEDQTQWLSVHERVQILEALALKMQQCSEELIVQAASEGGKPYADSQVEVMRAIAGVKLCAEHIQSHAGEVIPLNEERKDIRRVGYTQKEPLGVVVAVSAFNHPLNLIVHQIVTAVAAGCPVIVKPASETPLSCFTVVKMLHECGMQTSWVQAFLTSSNDVNTQLVSDARVGFFSFIGSAQVGWRLRSRLAPGTRCTLEHGGVAPVIVDESADIEKLIPAVVKGGFYHAGQVCVSVQKVFVPYGMLDVMTSRLAKAAEALKVGDPCHHRTEVGPLIRSEEVERVHEWVKDAMTEGAQCLVGGEVLANQCYSPTVLVNPSKRSKVSRDEIFGPVVCVYGYASLDDAIVQANRLNVAFQAAVFAQDIDRAHQIANRLVAKTVMINEHTAYRYDGMPFGGLRHSGLGVGGIGQSIDDMQFEKLIVLTTPNA